MTRTAAQARTVDHLPVMLARQVQITPSGCWQWTGTRVRSGHGKATYLGRKERAHRLVYALLIAPIPDRLLLVHRCHDADRTCPGGVTCPHRLCVRPSHLEPVTQAENFARAVRKPVA